MAAFVLFALDEKLVFDLCQPYRIHLQGVEIPNDETSGKSLDDRLEKYVTTL